MLAIVRTFTLDIGRPGQQEVQYARVGDSRVYCFLIRLNDRSEPLIIHGDATVMLVSTKPDGTMLTLPGLPEDGAAKVYLHSQALTAPGIVNCNLLVISADGATLCSPRFDLVVEDVEVTEGEISSSSDFLALAGIVRNVRGLVERVGQTIVGIPYATVEELAEAVPHPYPFSMYAVGEEAPYEIFRHTGDAEEGYMGWVSHGFIQGAVGPRYVPHVSEEGILTWTNDGGLPNPEPVDITGPQGQKGNDGGQGPQGVKGEDGLTTSVNGVQHEDGNIALTGENIPVMSGETRTIKEAIQAAKETRLALAPPTNAHNASRGVKTGARWVQQMATAHNLINSTWNDKNTWVIVKTGTSSVTDGTPFNDGIKGLHISVGDDSFASATVSMKRSLSAAPDVGHKLFFAFTYRRPTTPPSPLYSFPRDYITEVSIKDAAETVLGMIETFTLRNNQEYNTDGLMVEIPEDVQYPLSLEINVRANNSVSPHQLAVEGLVCLDMTADFGEGNEPYLDDTLKMFMEPLASSINHLDPDPGSVIPPDVERYFVEKGGLGRYRSFVCCKSDDESADWLEIPLLSDAKTTGLTASTGFSIVDGYTKIYRFGPFVCFEVLLNATVATTAGTIKEAFTGLPQPNGVVKFPVKTILSNTPVASSNVFLLLDPAFGLTTAVLQSVTAVAADTNIHCSGFYLAEDRTVT